MTTTLSTSPLIPHVEYQEAMIPQDSKIIDVHLEGSIPQLVYMHDTGQHNMENRAVKMYYVGSPIYQEYLPGQLVFLKTIDIEGSVYCVFEEVIT